MLLKRFAICRFSRETQTQTPWYQTLYLHVRPWPRGASDFIRLYGTTFRVCDWRFGAVHLHNRLNDHILTLHDTTNYGERWACTFTRTMFVCQHVTCTCKQSRMLLLLYTDLITIAVHIRLHCNVLANARQVLYIYFILFCYQYSKRS